MKRNLQSHLFRNRIDTLVMISNDHENKRRSAIFYFTSFKKEAACFLFTHLFFISTFSFCRSSKTKFLPRALLRTFRMGFKRVFCFQLLPLCTAAWKFFRVISLHINNKKFSIYINYKNIQRTITRPGRKW